MGQGRPKSDHPASNCLLWMEAKWQGMYEIIWWQNIYNIIWFHGHQFPPSIILIEDDQTEMMKMSQILKKISSDEEDMLPSNAESED